MIKYNSVLFWFRRDLRLEDNRGLFEACKKARSVYCAFVFDINILKKLKDKQDQRVVFIFQALKEMESKLKAKGSGLLILFGDPMKIIPELASGLGVACVLANEDYEPYAKKRDQSVKSKLLKMGVCFETFKDHVIFRGDEIKKKDGLPYKVFTPYKNQWLSRLSSDDIRKFSPDLKILVRYKRAPVQSIKTLGEIGFRVCRPVMASGEEQAHKLLKSFLKRVDDYHQNRDKIDLDSNSHLSPYLRFGSISIRELVRNIIDHKSEGAKVWLSELVWRDFYQMILDQFPHVEKYAFTSKYNNLRWTGKLPHFEKWKKGSTGYPIIDGAMRCLNKTGMMHNRLRMIVASFLVKDLLIDWRKGEKYFAEKLLDFDLAANNGGWQWCASTGCDAQPYFRIFNPVSQSKKFDQEGQYIKKWVPELKLCPAKYIHFPSDAPEDIQRECHFLIGRDYPPPIVHHATQRIEALKLFKIR
jgi:deoxyribodipyrimidine photo-lyase